MTKSLKDKKVKEREIAGLLEAMKEHKLKNGLIITEEEEGEEKIEKYSITIKSVYKWLLEK